MFTKENFKFFTLLSFVSILMFKLINSPSQVFFHIKNLMCLFSPFLFALFFVILINPIVSFLENTFRLNRFVSIFFSYITLSLVVSLVFNGIVPIFIDSLITLIKHVPTYIDEFNVMYNNYLPYNSSFDIISPDLKFTVDLLLNKVLDIISAYSSNILSYIFSITSVLFDILIGLILSIYILFEKEILILNARNLIDIIFKKRLASLIFEFFQTLHDIFYNFILGQFFDSLIIALFSFIGFKLFDIDNCLFFSFIIFTTNMIPYFGPFIGAFPPIFITFLSSPVKSFWIFIFLLILQQIDGNIIIPRIMHNQIGVSPLAIISSILIFDSLFGFIGVFFAIPCLGVFKYFLDIFISKKKAKV